MPFKIVSHCCSPCFQGCAALPAAISQSVQLDLARAGYLVIMEMEEDHQLCVQISKKLVSKFHLAHGLYIALRRGEKI